MRKALMLVTSIVLLAGPLFLIPTAAQSDEPGKDVPPPAVATKPPVANPMLDELNAKIAYIKAELRLSPDQEKMWPPFEGVLQELAKKRVERVMAMRERDRERKGPSGLIEEWHQRADMFGDRAAKLKILADAGGPLYGTLKDWQKGRFFDWIEPIADNW